MTLTTILSIYKTAKDKGYIKTAFSIIIIALIVLLFYMWRKENNNRKQQQNNFETELLNNFNTQQEITKKQYKTLYDSISDLSKKLNIKNKQVKTVTRNNYHYFNSDTTIIKIKEASPGVYPINYDNKCISYSGLFSTKDTTYKHTGGECNDILTSFIYWKRKPVDLFLFKLKIGKKVYYNKTYSKCKQDTIETILNLKVGK